MTRRAGRGYDVGMSRVPDHPSKPIKPLRTLGDYAAAGVALVSHCSSDPRHWHYVDFDALIAERGSGVEVDYHFKQSLTCPECGAPGGGLQIRPPGRI